MTRRRKTVLAALALLLVLVGAGLGWLLGSTAGAAWLLAQLGRFEGGAVQAQVQGSLWAGLELAELEVRWPGGELRGDRLRLVWHPLALLRGRLEIEELAARHLRLRRTPQPPRPEASSLAAAEYWPRLPGWLPALGGELASLSVAELGFGPPEAETLALTDLRGRLQLEHGRLQGRDLHIGLPCGVWDGSVSLDLRQRQLDADLLWRGEAPFAADWDGVRSRVSLEADLSGPLQATLLAGESPRAEVQGQAVLDPAGVDLRQLEIRRSGGPDRIGGALRVAWEGGFLLSGDLQLEKLDLATETGWPTDLSGRVVASLDTHGYRGEVDLVSRRPGLEQGTLRGNVAGGWHGLQIDLQHGEWLGGELNGALQLSWQREFVLRAELDGRKLDPAGLVPELSASLNLHARGGLQVRDGELSADWEAKLERSQLQGKTLEGALVGRWQQNELTLERLQLRGDGLQLEGSGRLAEGLALQLQVADLGRVGRGWQGAIDADGRLGRRAGAWFGELTASGGKLQFRELQAAAGSLTGRLAPSGELQLDLQLESLVSGYGTLDSMRLQGRGSLAEHQLELVAAGPAERLTAALAGGWQADRWRGELRRLQVASQQLGTWELAAPAGLQLGTRGVELEGLELAGKAGGRLQLAGALGFEPAHPLSLQGDWEALPLALLTPWLGELRLDGSSSGRCRLESPNAGELSLHAELSASSRWQWHDQQLELLPLQLRIDWNGQGLKLDGNAGLASGGDLLMAASSAEPGHRGWPATGRWQLQWDRIPLGVLNPWLPIGLQLGGEWLGELSGDWRGSAPPQLAGRSWLEQGEVTWQGEEGLLRVPLEQAELGFDWDRRSLRGKVDLQLSGQGQVQGRGEIARPAAWPPRLTPADRLSAELDYRVDELGLLAALLPGAVDETRGALQGQLQLGGRLGQPQLTGDFALRDAAAQLPVAGLQLSDIAVAGHFAGQQVAFETLQLRSGEGLLQGSGSLRLDGWRPAAWSFDLVGERLLLANLAEFRMVASPQLQFSGGPGRYRLRGKLAVPELLLSEIPKPGLVKPSEDVQVVGREPEPELFQPRHLDLELLVTLGDKVVVKARGLDARLTGEVTLFNTPQASFTGRGEIRVAEGNYAAYGLKLPIEHGRALFAGGPLVDPSLDVLALRTIGGAGGTERVSGAALATPNLEAPVSRSAGTVKAGVRVTGTPRRPVVTLVSEPSLPETDILSYIVLGRPLDAGGGETDSLMLAARALLSQGDSALLQQKLKNRLGIDTLEVQSSSNGGVTDSVITVGKYLTPELYLSYGRALFTPNNYAQLRYRFAPDWELESQLGTVSGADLFYRIEFR